MKITVITINYNDREGLLRTLESVRRQTVKNFEYIVVDGGSTDGSVDVIKENESIISKWVSEPDSGIYNAMNKGVGMGGGDFCLFLNSGDTLHSDDSIEKMMKTEFKAPIVLTRVLNFEDDSHTLLYIPPRDVTLREIYQKGIHHAGSFISTELLRQFPYREDLKILSDRDFFIKTIIFENVPYQIVDSVICNFEYGGASSNRQLIYEERDKMLSSYFPPRLMAEYKRSNLQILEMSTQLEKCRYKIISMICTLDIYLIKILKLILGRKIYHNKYL